jgi:pyruvate dehydrogenase E1 component alpha subunit
MPGEVIDGMDVLAVFDAAGACIDRARRGDGPSLLECKTYRFYDHVGVTGMRIPYRQQDEVDAWKARDPITAIELYLAGEGVLDPDGAAQVHQEVLDDIADAIAFAEASALPDVSTLTDDVYTNPILIGGGR